MVKSVMVGALTVTALVTVIPFALAETLTV